MDKKFTQRDIAKIAKALGVEPKFKGNNYRFVIENEETKRHISLEIYPELKIGEKTGSLISVYTPSAHLQMHFCSGFVVSEMLGEVTFVAECGNRLSGLIVEKEGGCSLYANVDNSLLSGDFTKLGPEVMLSGIALSLAESVLPELSR
jgi:hypothetical protein